MSALFVTGSDTDVGKTYVSALLVAALQTMGSTAYMKPVQTGCSRLDESRLTVPDFEAVCPLEPCTSDQAPYRFVPACSPHLAAKLAGTAIEIPVIVSAFKRVRARFEHVLVEGAGGVLAPLSETECIVDLIAALGCPAVVVTTPRLGTLNHTMLTLNALHSASIPLAGVVLNNPLGLERDYIYSENLRYLSDHAGAPVLEVTHNQSLGSAVQEFCREICARF